MSSQRESQADIEPTPGGVGSLDQVVAEWPATSGRWGAQGRAHALPYVPGVLTSAELVETAESIASVQLDNGMIPWFPGGHADAWNHVEAAMALAVCGLFPEAERAYEWLAASQHQKDRFGAAQASLEGFEGSWYAYYLAEGIEDPRRETNMCAYVATGVWHHYCLTQDSGFLDEMWPVVDRAINFVLRWQQSDGTILWSVDEHGSPGDHALLTGSSSICHSLRCALALAEVLGTERPKWEWAAAQLSHAVAFHPERFAPKDEFAMDWYYPVLAGSLSGESARARLSAGWATYVMEGVGVRCVSDQPWVTAAETAECVLALDGAGLVEEAYELMAKVQLLRCEDGSYWTGLVFPDQIAFPFEERSTYTAGAMILAAHALSGAGPAAGLFRGEGLPSLGEIQDMTLACNAHT